MCPKRGKEDGETVLVVTGIAAERIGVAAGGGGAAAGRDGQLSEVDGGDVCARL